MSVPAKFRASLNEGCVVTRGLDRCLWLYPVKEWEKMALELSKLPVTQQDARSFARLMLAGAMDLKIDKVGRINLPGYLKEYAGISSKIVVTGMYNRLEIWPEEKWQEFKTKMEENSNQIAENLSEIGF